MLKTFIIVERLRGEVLKSYTCECGKPAGAMGLAVLDRKRKYSTLTVYLLTDDPDVEPYSIARKIGSGKWYV